MDHVDLRTKGFFGILGTSIRLIHSHRRLFLSLTFFTLLPLAALSLANRPIAYRLNDSKYSGLLYQSDSLPKNRTRDAVIFLVYLLAYSIIYILALLLAAGAAIHAAASAYASKESSSLRKSLFRAAPRAWPRLLGTAFFVYLLTLVYALVGGFIFGLTIVLATVAVDAAVVLRVLAIILVCVVGIAFIAGFLFFTALGYLSIAATVLERAAGSEACWGIAAIKKARALIRGRVFMSCAMVVVFSMLFFGVEVCWAIVLSVDYVALAGRIAAGIFILLGLAVLLLLALTVLTVAYLVLKAWHGEAVDPASLSSSLDACAGKYEKMVPNGSAAGNLPHQMV